MEFRTQEQLDTIIESAYNGNHRQAAEQAVEYGFYAGDINKMIDAEEIGTTTLIDLLYVVEIAAEIRGKAE